MARIYFVFSTRLARENISLDYDVVCIDIPTYCSDLTNDNFSLMAGEHYWQNCFHQCLISCKTTLDKLSKHFENLSDKNFKNKKVVRMTKLWSTLWFIYGTERKADLSEINVAYCNICDPQRLFDERKAFFAWRYKDSKVFLLFYGQKMQENIQRQSSKSKLISCCWCRNLMSRVRCLDHIFTVRWQFINFNSRRAKCGWLYKKRPYMYSDKLSV